MEHPRRVGLGLPPGVDHVDNGGLLLGPQLGPPAPNSPARPCREQTSLRALADHGPLELGKAAHHLHEHPTGRGGRVNGFGQAAKARTRVREVVQRGQPLRGLRVTACEQYSAGLQTSTCVGQRFVRIRASADQHSVRMDQRSYAKGLQTCPWANAACEQAERLGHQSLGSLCIRSTGNLQVKRAFAPVMYLRMTRFNSERMSPF